MFSPSGLKDGTAAAERFFGQKPHAMFTAILASVALAPAPLRPLRKTESGRHCHRGRAVDLIV